jgi:hypothetical protein
MSRLRSWRERIHDMNCPDCWRRVAHRRRMREQLGVIYPEPTQDEVDSWLMVNDEPEDDA